MVTSISRSPEETVAIGESWGREAKPGWIFGFTGELGAGKTQIIRGIARGLGYQGRVHSPTFAIINLYDGGRLPIAHLDLYRLAGRDEIIQADLAEHLESPQGIALVEWFDRWCPEHESPQLEFGFHLRRALIRTLSENEREICYEDFGH